MVMGMVRAARLPLLLVVVTTVLRERLRWRNVTDHLRLRLPFRLCCFRRELLIVMSVIVAVAMVGGINHVPAID